MRSSSAARSPSRRGAFVAQWLERLELDLRLGDGLLRRVALALLLLQGLKVVAGFGEAGFELLLGVFELILELAAALRELVVVGAQGVEARHIAAGVAQSGHACGDRGGAAEGGFGSCDGRAQLGDALALRFELR